MGFLEYWQRQGPEKPVCSPPYYFFLIIVICIESSPGRAIKTKEQREVKENRGAERKGEKGELEQERVADVRNGKDKVMDGRHMRRMKGVEEMR